MADVSSYIKSDEKVVEVIRRHWINILPLMIGWTCMGLVGLYGFYILGRYQDQASANSPVFFGSIGLVALMLLAGMLAYISFWIYTQNFIILTNKNLYQVTQGSLFSNEVSQFSLERLQDVVAKQDGILATMLGFGDIVVETAGEQREFVFVQCRDPRETASRIMKCHKDAVASGEGAKPSP